MDLMSMNPSGKYPHYDLQANPLIQQQNQLTQRIDEICQKILDRNYTFDDEKKLIHLVHQNTELLTNVTLRAEIQACIEIIEETSKIDF